MDWVTPLALIQSGPDWGTMATVFVGSLTVGGAIYATTRSRLSSKEANAVNLVGQLFARVESLEKKDEEKDNKITELSSVMSVSLSYIERLIHWGRGGGEAPEPMAPTQLQDRLAHLINDRNED